jgi:hypothetical protein
VDVQPETKKRKALLKCDLSRDSPIHDSGSTSSSLPSAPIAVNQDLTLDSPVLKTEQRVVKPFVRKPRVKPVDTLIDVLKDIVAGQEKFTSRMTKYDKAVQILQRRFSFGLTFAQQTKIVCLFADHPSYVNQFMSFSEDQRDVFVANHK